MLRYFLLIPVLLFYSCQSNKDNITSKQDASKPKPIPNRISTDEDPNARANYFAKMLAVPSTGEIPEGIRQRELRFAVDLPKQNSRFRTDGLNAEDWQSSGPYNIGGRTRALAYDVRDVNILLAGGVSGRMWRSEDFGESWQQVTTTEDRHSITAIAQDTRAGMEDVWYFGAGEIQGNSARGGNAPYRGSGMYKSMDNGKTWSLIPSTFNDPAFLESPFQYVNRIIVNTFNLSQDEILVAGFGGIYRTLNGGQDWQRVLGAPVTNGDGVSPETPFYTELHQTETGVYYASISESTIRDPSPNSGVYRSEDGINWTRITPVFGWPNEYSNIEISSLSNSDEVLFFVDSDNTPRLFHYTYLSGNGTGSGGRWQDRSVVIPVKGILELQNSYNMVLCIDPNSNERIYLGGTSLFRSLDGFTSNGNTTHIGGYDPENLSSIYTNHYPDQHELLFLPGGTGEALSATDGGVFYTSDINAEEVQWQSLNNGYLTSQFYTVDISKTASDRVIGGMQDNGSSGSRFFDARSEWNDFLSGDGSYCFISRDNSYVYASAQESIIYRFTINSDFDYTTFSRVDPIGAGEDEEQPYLFINPFEIDPINNNVMYLAGGDRIWINTNLSQIELFVQEKQTLNWSSLDYTRIDEGQISAVRSGPNGDLLFFGTSRGQVFKIEDPQNFGPMTEITPAGIEEGSYVSSIGIDPRNSNNIAVIYSNYQIPSIFYSTNGGSSFQDVSGNLEENPDGSGNGPSIRWIAIVPLQNEQNMYFVGTSTGLYSASDLTSTTNWIQEGVSSIGNAVVTMVKHNPTSGMVAAATHGVGVFTSNFPESVVEGLFQGPELSMDIQNAYPNPFPLGSTMETKIPFTLNKDGIVEATIYNTLGQNVRNISKALMYKGQSEVTWDGMDDSGNRVPSGQYFCKITQDGNSISAPIVYITP